jgi:hypothetical protein
VSQIGQVGEVGDVESDRICRAALVSFMFAEILTSANSVMVKKGGCDQSASSEGSGEKHHFLAAHECLRLIHASTRPWAHAITILGPMTQLSTDGELTILGQLCGEASR